MNTDQVTRLKALLRDLLDLQTRANALLAEIDEGPAAVAGEQIVPYRPAGDLDGRTLHEAARRALVAAGQPLHVRDLGARIKAGGWRHPRAKDPRPDQIEFQLAARLARMPAVFRRVAPNTFGLASWPPPVAARTVPRLVSVEGYGDPLAREIGDRPDLIFGAEPRWRSS